MRARREFIRYQEQHPSFTCFRFNRQQFEFYWHFHPEIELTYIISGEGIRVTGDSMETFSAGDLVLSGPGLPHTWVSDKHYKGRSEAVVLQFSEEVLQGFLHLPEFLRLRLFLEKAPYGIHFTAATALKYQQLLCGLVAQPGDIAFVQMLELLCGLAKQKYRLLSRAAVRSTRWKQDTDRVNSILQYIEKRCGDKIRVEDAAAILHLSKSAFCKFFKKHLGKNFTAYVNEVRVGRACFLLLHTDSPVKNIAYECGFDNLSYFNRIFVDLKKVQPSVYRRQSVKGLG